MDNDKQINRGLITTARDRFLDIPLNPDESQGQVFLIEHEFEKTRKNRNLWIPFILLLFLAGLAILGSLLMINIDAESKQLPSSIADQFQDIKLKDILDTAKKQTQSLESAKRSLSDVESERDGKIKTVRQDASIRIDLVTQSTGTDEEKQSQIAVIRRNAQIREAQIRREYEGVIKAKEEEIKKTQIQLSDYEKRLDQTDRARQDYVASEQRALELEKQKLKKYYEEKISENQAASAREITAQRRGQEAVINLLKKNHKEEIETLKLLYNPIFTEPNILSILSSPDVVINSSAAQNTNQSLVSDEAWASKSYDDLKKAQNSITILFNRIKSIPFINSMPSAIQGMEKKIQESFARYEILWSRTASKIVEKNKMIRQLEEIQQPLISMVNSYAATVQENGFVMDPKDSQKMSVYIQKVFQIKAGDRGIVFRGDDEEIAKVELTSSESGNIYARVLSLKDITKPVRAFDRILLERK